MPSSAGMSPCAPPAIAAAAIATGSSSRPQPRARIHPRRPDRARARRCPSRARMNAMHPIVSASTIAKSMVSIVAATAGATMGLGLPFRGGRHHVPFGIKGF